MRITVICLVLAIFSVKAADLSKLPSPPANVFGFVMIGSSEKAKVMKDNTVFINKVIKTMWKLTENDPFYGHIALGFNNFFENPETDSYLYEDGLKMVYLAYDEDDSALKQYIVDLYYSQDLRPSTGGRIASTD